jgi:DNA processing protein
MVSPVQLRYLQLFHLDGFSLNICARLVKQAGSLTSLLEDQFKASEDRPVDQGLLETFRERFLEPVDQTRELIEITRRWLDQSDNRHLLCYEESGYPAPLREIACPPPLLFVEGDPVCLCLPQLAMVGSRKASRNGEHTAFCLARDLAASGIGITSGMAAGIDGQAHRGALAAGGWTVGVMGTGLDRIYPSRHRQLGQQVTTNGALISEFPLGTPPLPANFPRRNRIIAGLSLGVVVVEAALPSGSLITAQLALEANREVFAVPGSIHCANSRGCHQLIKDGARLVDSVGVIFEELALPSVAGPELAGDPAESDRQVGSRQPHKRNTRAVGNRQAALPRLDETETRLLDLMGFDPCPADLLARRSGLAIDVVNRALIGLELKGLLEHVAGRYRRLVSGLQDASD